jgi:hypothetical protein
MGQSSPEDRAGLGEDARGVNRCEEVGTPSGIAQLGFGDLPVIGAGLEPPPVGIGIAVFVTEELLHPPLQ